MSLVKGRRLNYKFEGHKILTSERRFKSLMPERMEIPPPMIDRRAQCSPIEDQGDEGSCSAHAAAGALEFLQIKEMTGPQVYDPGTFEKVSRNFIYYQERAMEGTANTDAGATTLLDACKTLMNIGVCRESVWPYSQDTLFTAPSDDAVAEAALHKVQNYYGLDANYQLKQCLWFGFPFMLGFQVFESFMSDEVAANGIMPMPSAGDQIVGGHAVLAVGYDDSKQTFIIRNSWGPNWGQAGYFEMPYAFMNSQYCDDFYTLRLAPTTNP